MTLPPFSVTWDYRCPFARNANEHLLAGLADGADWQVDFLPYSLSQVHVEEGELPAWEDPSKASELLSLEAAVVVKERFPEHFLAVHGALFSARHDESQDLREEKVLVETMKKAGLQDTDAVMAEVSTGWPKDAVRKAHEQAVADHQVFGVPTFIVSGRAAFVRLMDRPNGDGALARQTIERVIGMIEGHPEVNELKHTTVDR